MRSLWDTVTGESNTELVKKCDLIIVILHKSPVWRTYNLLQVFVQEAQEFQQGIDDLRYRRKAAGGYIKNAATAASDSESPDVNTIHAVLLAYSKALQHALLVKQCLHYDAERLTDIERVAGFI